MIDFFFLVPIAIGLGLIGLASFMWTLKNGQYDDLQGAAERILFEGQEGPLPEQRYPGADGAKRDGDRDEVDRPVDLIKRKARQI
jgi:cbb3-type cytochrome oxidase maturation protein